MNFVLWYYRLFTEFIENQLKGQRLKIPGWLILTGLISTAAYVEAMAQKNGPL